MMLNTRLYGDLQIMVNPLELKMKMFSVYDQITNLPQSFLNKLC